MRQAIKSSYLGPTNSRGGRVRATCDAGSKTTPWDHALDAPENHARAVLALCEKLGWDPRYYLGGGIGDGYVWVDARSGVPYLPALANPARKKQAR